MRQFSSFFFSSWSFIFSLFSSAPVEIPVIFLTRVQKKNRGRRDVEMYLYGKTPGVISTNFLRRRVAKMCTTAAFANNSRYSTLTSKRL